MRNAIILIVTTLTAIPAMAQRSADYGVSAGIITYLGEENPLNLYYRPGPAVQFTYRYNFNPRQAVRVNLLGGYVMPLNAPLEELGVTYEFNFFPYSTFRSRHIDYTPYLAAGAAVSMINSDAMPVFPSIPFSAGFKINVANQVGIEFEYGFRKTFTDKLDGLYEITDPVTQDPVDHTWTHNNDWYSFMGISVTWKIYNKLMGCPAFAEMEKGNKRRKR
jgi:hypothetical protein